MIKHTLLAAGIAVVMLTHSLGQAPGPSPTETKLKELVKSLTQRVTQAEQDKATLQSEKATADTKIKELEVQVKKTGEALKQSADDMSKLREESTKKEETLNSEIAAKKSDLEAHKKNLENWKAAHVEISGIAKKKEAERSKQAAIAAALERRVADLRTRNAAMFATANEVLDRFKMFGLGEAIAAREPFTGNMRVKLKNQLQEFTDDLLDATADSKRPAPTSDAAPKAEAPKAEAPKTEAPKTEAPKAEAPIVDAAPPKP
jgi:colicin import membrane protein